MRNLITATMILIMTASMTLAETTKEALVPLPSVFDFTRGSGWGIALGAGVEYETAYDGSDEKEFEIDPTGAIQWRTGNHLLFIEGYELGWRGLFSDTWLVQVGGRWEGGREADDSEDGWLDGLEDQDDEPVGVLEVRKGFGKDWRNWIAGRVMAGSSDIGILGVLAAGHRFGSATDGTGTEIFVFSTFGNADFFNRDFGISYEDSLTSGYPETDLDGGYRSTGITLIDRRYIGDHIHIISQAGLEYYCDEIQDSPIAREDYEFEVGVSVVYHF